VEDNVSAKTVHSRKGGSGSYGSKILQVNAPRPDKMVHQVLRLLEEIATTTL
jgi:hypothetical protein